MCNLVTKETVTTNEVKSSNHLPLIVASMPLAISEEYCQT